MARKHRKHTIRLPKGVLIGVLVVAFGAAALSFDSLDGLGQRVGWTDKFLTVPVIGWQLALSVLLPITIDAQAAVATWAWLHPSTSQTVRDHAKVIAVSSLAASVVGNAAEHLMAAYEVDTPWGVIAIVGAVPAVSLFATVHLCSQMIADFQQARADAEKQHDIEVRAVEEATRKPEPRKPRRATGSAEGSATSSAPPAPNADTEQAPDATAEATATSEPATATTGPDRATDTETGEAGETATALLDRLITEAVNGGTPWPQLKAADIAREARKQLPPGATLSDALARRVVGERREAEMKRYVAAQVAEGRPLADIHPQELISNVGGKNAADVAPRVLDDLRAAAFRTTETPTHTNDERR